MALAAMFVLGYVVAAALDVILRLWFRSTGFSDQVPSGGGPFGVAGPLRSHPAVHQTATQSAQAITNPDHPARLTSPLPLRARLVSPRSWLVPSMRGWFSVSVGCVTRWSRAWSPSLGAVRVRVGVATPHQP